MGDIQKILMIQGESQYDAISCFMNDLADGFRQLGVEWIFWVVSQRMH